MRTSCLLLATALLLTSCSPKTQLPKTPALDAASSYVDLQAGWRLRVVTPILKSGGYVIAAHVGTVDTKGEFLGYETAFYGVTAKPFHRLLIEFQSASIKRGDKTEPRPTPLKPLFQIPKPMNAIRLVYLERASQADHNMAVLATRRTKQLTQMTLALLEDPARNCVSGNDTYCSWIPAGIAVRPFKPNETD